MKKISVIIPAKNRVEFTREAIRSVYAQKLPRKTKLEVIVVDNRSSPPIEPILSGEFPEAIFLKNSRFDSPGGTRNTGLKACSGDYIAFLDNDDKWREGFIESAVSALSLPNVSASICLTSPWFYGEYPTRQKIKIIFLNLIRTTSMYLLFFLNKGRVSRSAFYLTQVSHMLFRASHIRGLRFYEKWAAAEGWAFVCSAMSRGELAIILSPLLDFRYEIRSNTNTAKVKAKKWQAYVGLLDKLSVEYKKFPWYQLFRRYIAVFS